MGIQTLASSLQLSDKNASSGTFMAKSATGPVVPFQISRGLFM